MIHSTNEYLNKIFHLYKSGNYSDFNFAFYLLYRNYLSNIAGTVSQNFRISEEDAHEAVQNSYLLFFLSFHNDEKVEINSIEDLYNKIYETATRIIKDKHFLNKKKKEINWNTNLIVDENDNSVDNFNMIEPINNSTLKINSNEIYFPEYLIRSSEFVLRDNYKGKKNIDKFINDHKDCLKLIELKYVYKFPYEKIITLPEFSGYSIVALRKKASRCLEKYKKHISLD